jgi:DNA processing protein
MTARGACERCVARSWLLARLAGHLEPVRQRIEPLLGLADQDLIAAVGGEQRDTVARELERFDVVQARARCAASGLEQICRCESAYPASLAALESAPAVLHVAGGLERFLDLVQGEPVALVGARQASPYGLQVAGSLARGLGAAGITVLSGMAIGIDSAAHAGALDVGAPTVAVLAGGAERPYPASKRALHRRIQAGGAVVSELPPGVAPRRWMFPARNRIIAGLSAMTVVIEARRGSGALLTAAAAHGLQRAVGAVPGRITSPLAWGPNELLSVGAQLVRGPQDVLDCLFGAGARVAPGDATRPDLRPELRALLQALGDGHDAASALIKAGFAVDHGLAALASLELGGYLRREAGGRFSVIP